MRSPSDAALTRQRSGSGPAPGRRRPRFWPRRTTSTPPPTRPSGSACGRREPNGTERGDRQEEVPPGRHARAVRPKRASSPATRPPSVQRLTSRRQPSEPGSTAEEASSERDSATADGESAARGVQEDFEITLRARQDGGQRACYRPPRRQGRPSWCRPRRPRPADRVAAEPRAEQARTESTVHATALRAHRADGSPTAAASRPVLREPRVRRRRRGATRGDCRPRTA